jgi:hypothetical protein
VQSSQFEDRDADAGLTIGLSGAGNGGSQGLTVNAPNLDRLTAIWERGLKRSLISPDNFFDIGGDYIHAIAILQEIEREMGKGLQS